MGMFMSIMGRGLPTTQMISFIMGTLYKQFMEKDIDNFPDFHKAMLDIFNTINSALPGKHYDVPSRNQVEECFENWKRSAETEKKKVFVEFMKQRVSLSKPDDSTMIIGIVTPPAAMAVKKAGENVPQLKIVKSIPDVIFVPSVTVLALISTKLSRRIILSKMAS